MAKITVDLDGARAKLSDDAMNRGRYAMGNQMLADMIQYVPKRDSILRPTGHLTSDNKKIIFDTPYAKAQFQGKIVRRDTGKTVVFRKYSEPGTGKRWDEKAKGLHLPAWKRAFLRGAGY